MKMILDGFGEGKEAKEAKEAREENLKKILHSSKPFLNISEGLVNYFVKHTMIRNLPKGSFLWKKDEPGDFAYVVLSGFVEISYPTQTGEERLVGIFGPNDVIGLSAVLRKTTYPANAKSCCNSTVFLKLYVETPEAGISNELLIELKNWEREMLFDHEQILREKIRFTGAGKVHLKLVELLQHFALRFGPVDEKNSIPLPLTKTQLAQLIDTRVETVIRILNRWQKMGYLKMGSDKIQILDLESMKSSKETGKIRVKDHTDMVAGSRPISSSVR